MTQPDCPETLKRAAIYTRSHQLNPLGGTNSIQLQIDLCKTYCAEHGYMLPEDQLYYEMRDGTGDTDQPELSRLTKAAQQGLIDILVIASRERLTRNARANAQLIERLKARGITLETAEEPQSEQS